MQDLDAKVIEFVQQITSAMGLALEVTTEEMPDNIRLNLSGEGADVLLRRKGEALDALQVIVNTAFRRDARGDRHYVVDALGFRKGKDAELRQMAQFLMDKARTSGVAAGNRPAQSLRPAHRPPDGGGRRDAHVGKHRRRVSQERRDLAEGLNLLSRGFCSDGHHRRGGDPTGPRRHWRRPAVGA